MLWMPGLNLFLGIAHAFTSNKEEFLKRMSAIMDKKSSLVWLPGGFEDVVNVECKYETISVPYGWIKYTLMHGCNVVPVYHLGEHDSLRLIKLPFQALRRCWSKRVQFPFVAPYINGKYGLPIPIFKKTPITIIGKATKFPEIANPTKNDIEKYRNIYCEKLKETIYKGSQGTGYEGIVVRIIN